MKLRIEVDEKIKEDEVIIKCSVLSDEVRNMQRALGEIISQKARIIFYKDTTEYYISLEDILFFKTDGANVSGHTVGDVYSVKYKLYELEEILPKDFIRVSKSTILNAKVIYSISRNITASSIVEFKNTHKKVYVSRLYYKPLKFKLEEMRR